MILQGNQSHTAPASAQARCLSRATKFIMKAKSVEYIKIDDEFFKSSDEYREVSSEEFVKEVKIIAESL